MKRVVLASNNAGKLTELSFLLDGLSWQLEPQGALGVSEADLELWNALDPESRLQPKLVLVAWVPSDFDAEKRGVVLLDPAKLVVVTRGSPEHLDLAEARRGRVRTEYVAQGKEKLEDVARKFGMRKYDLARINQIDSNTTLAKGDKVIVYQVTDPGRSERAAEQWQKMPKGRRGKVVGEPARVTAGASTAGAGTAEPKPASAPSSAPPVAPASELPPEEDGPVTRPTQAD